ncbi:unnamed protein product [Debaryomyces tyrocola]|nr:unnamed protein product [Debaryomyces tyrocola]
MVSIQPITLANFLGRRLSLNTRDAGYSKEITAYNTLAKKLWRNLVTKNNPPGTAKWCRVAMGD